MIHKGRRITSTASVIITIMMTVLFATVWFLFYNRLTFHTYIDFGLSKISGAFTENPQ
jgi:hypothetical protein